MTPDDVQVRLDICAACRDGCDEHRAGRIEVLDPCAACPRRIWHAHGNCGAVAEPGLVEMAANLASAGRDVVATAVSGRPILVDPATYRARLETCRACEWWSDGARIGLGKCRKCGCTRLKLRLAALQCPARKWPRMVCAAPLHGA